jgi:hypothetical protein
MVKTVLGNSMNTIDLLLYLKIAGCLDVMPSNLIGIDHHFGGTFHTHLQDRKILSLLVIRPGQYTPSKQ